MQSSDEPQYLFAVWDSSDAAERAAWLDCWERWPNREVFAHPSYGELFVQENERFLCASLVTPESGMVLYPFLLRKSPNADESGKSVTDITSPYGYGGPYVWGGSNLGELSSVFWREFDSWAAAHNVVTEFVRFDLHSEALLDYLGTKVVRSQNIVIPLQGNHDEIWMRFEHKVRKNVKKAQRSGVSIHVDLTGACLSEFLELYEGTMDRREAGAGYYFGRAFFEKLNSEMEGQFAYFNAFVDGRIVSTELVLVSARSVYSFLGGTNSSAFALRPNDLLKYEVIQWAQGQGKKDFVLGGGAEPGDGIERYKRSFAPDGVVEFVTGQRILSQPAYESLVVQRRQEFASAGRDWPEESEFFPKYRLGI